MNELIALLERAEKCLFSLSHGLRHQPDPSVLSDQRNGIYESVARAKEALTAALQALEGIE